MSTRLAPIDLTGASVGTTGTVTLPHPAVQVDELAHLRLYNESGCGLNIAFDNQHTEAIPAGAWPMFEIEPEVRQFTYTVYYVLPNAPVSTVSGVYYYPYEGVPPTPALGNSPIGVTGGVQTTSIQTLINDGNPLPSVLIEATPAAAPGSTIAINTDGSVTIKGDVAGVLTTLLQLIPSAGAGANSVIIGDSARKTTVLGTLEVDGTMFPNQMLVFGDLLMQAGTNIRMQQSGIGVNANGDTLGITQAGTRYDTHVKTPGATGTGSTTWLEAGGAQVFKVTETTAEMINGLSLIFNSGGSISRIGFGAFTPGAGISTITHNFGFVPTVAIWSGGHAANVNPGTTTASIYNWAANTCTINNFAAVDGLLLYLKV